MSEFRRDVVSGRWVIIAPERAARPTDFPVERRRRVGGFCPFCAGNEDKTPPEILALRDGDGDADGPGWRVRVVPNRFPALRIEGALNRWGDGLGPAMGGFGAHEVIIEGPNHVVTLCEMGVDGVREVLEVYRERLADLKRDERLAYGMLFKNVGAAAGATLEHSHSQLIAMPVVPRTVSVELAHAGEFREETGACVFCQTVARESAEGTRIIHDGEHFIAFAPYASRFPFETWIVPRQHVPQFEEHPPETFADLATALCSVLSRLDEALNLPAYNYIVHTAPFRNGDATDFHWHIEVIPRLTRAAGFEWGTGCYINPVLPESAAEALRAVGEPEPRRQRKEATSCP